MDNVQFQGYKMLLKFNASHSMTDRSAMHVHSFILKLYIKKENDAFVEFNKYEKSRKIFKPLFRRFNNT